MHTGDLFILFSVFLLQQVLQKILKLIYRLFSHKTRDTLSTIFVCDKIAMNKKKQKDVESSKSEVLNRHYHEISHELQESIELLSNLTKYIIREIDLNGNAKTITSNLSEIMTKTVGITTSMKSIRELTVSQNNEYSSCLKDLAELSEHLKKENMVLRAQQYKPPAMHDAGVNTDDNEMWSPERHAAHLAREVKTCLFLSFLF
jgi:hypothetical protein